MQIEHNGIILWYGTPDAPAPEDSAPADTDIPITIGVQPADASNTLEIHYQVDRGPTHRIEARFLRNAPARRAQYFQAILPAFRAGETVEYAVICRCAGRQVPPPETTEQFVSSFRVQTTEAQPSREATTRPTPSPTEVHPASLSLGNVRSEVLPPQTAVTKRISASYAVSGQIRPEGDTPLPGTIVRAYDKDLRSESLIGEAIADESGRYEMTYTSEQLSRPEKRRANLVVRAFSPEGIPMAESEVKFNAGEQEAVDLVAVPPKLSEYEKSMALLRPLLQEIPLHELTEEEISFLAREATLDPQHLQILVRSAQLAQETDLPIAAFYGWARQELPLELHELLAQETEQLQTALERSIEANFIPTELTERLDEISQLLETLRRERSIQEAGVLVPHEVTLRLRDRDSDESLSNYTVQAFDLDAGSEPQELGFDMTDGSGMVNVVYTTPDTESPAPRRIQLRVTDSEGEEIERTDVAIAPDQREEVDVAIAVPQAPKIASPSLQELNQNLQLQLPPELLSRLEAEDIRTVDDIRKAGGISQIDDLPVDAEHEAVRTLEGHANLNVLSDDVNLNETLIEKGFDSVVAIAKQPRVEFVNAVREEIDESRAQQLHAQATAVDMFLHNLMTETAVTAANGFPSPIQKNGATSKTAAKCQCKDCESAVSPLAYLADLLNYAIKNLNVSLSYLTQTFHQPFGDLPVSCEEMEKKVRQVRICIEVLRRYLLENKLPAQNSSEKTELDKAEAKYRREAYEELLTNLGTAYEEIRLAQQSDKKTRKVAADRLGIGVQHLDELTALNNKFLNKPTTLTEKDLEEYFGLVDTNRNPLCDGAKFGEIVGRGQKIQILRWNLDGVEWNRNTDVDGRIYVSLTKIPLQELPDLPVQPSRGRRRTGKAKANDFGCRVQLYRDSKRTDNTLVAEGTRATATGSVLLSERNGSGLSGSFEIQYNADTNQIEISAIPRLLSWRLQYLRQQWARQDWPDNAYIDTFLFETESKYSNDLEQGLISPSLHQLFQHAGRELLDKPTVTVGKKVGKKDKLWFISSKSHRYFVSKNGDKLKVFGARKLPAIDPDIIGPDDFRCPFAKVGKQPERAFDIWLARRKWVDNQLSELKGLTELIEVKGTKESFPSLALMFKRMMQPIIQGEKWIAWKIDSIKAAELPEKFDKLFDELGKLLDSIQDSDSKISKKAENTVQANLKLSAASFIRLMTLCEKDRVFHSNPKQKQVTQSEWEEVYSILVQAQKEMLCAQWIEEEIENSVRLSLKEFWASLRTPQEGQWPPAMSQKVKPTIDPDELTLKDLAEPMIGNRAIALWKSRQKTLKHTPKALRALYKDEEQKQVGSGFNAILKQALDRALGQNVELVEELEKLKDKLNNPSKQKEAEDTIKDTLYMLVEDFIRLMDIKAKKQPTEDEWNQVYRILAKSQKFIREYPQWHGEEKAQNFEYWEILKARLPRWRATLESRQKWVQALRIRSRAPSIDPDLISKDNFSDSKAGKLGYQIWQDRKKNLDLKVQKGKDELASFDIMLVDALFTPGTIDAFIAKLKQKREKDSYEALLKQEFKDFPLSTLFKLSALFSQASASTSVEVQEARQIITERLYLPLSHFQILIDILAKDKDPNQVVTDPEWSAVYEYLAYSQLIAIVMSLAKAQNQGEDITSRLKQFCITPAAFAYLLHTRDILTQAKPGHGSLLLDTEWLEIESILTQVIKQHQFSDWQDKEQEQTLSHGPDVFQIPQPQTGQYPSQTLPSFPKWRASLTDYLDWENRLQARIDQHQNTIASFFDAISSAEETILPTLRDALIEATDNTENELTDKAKSLTDQLLIDTQVSGCQKTTRISQAIETLQSLLWSIRTAQLYDTYPQLKLLNDDVFDEEWNWIGSYTTWRAAMFVFLYPENILIPTLRKHQTPGFQQLIDNLRKNRNLNPEQACQEAKKYSDYFRDICNLDVEATCHAETRIFEGKCRDRKEVEKRPLFYMFARGRHTNTVYWSAYDPTTNVQEYAQTFWETIPNFKNATKVIGAHPYRVADKEQYICLFACIHEQGTTKLRFARYNLEASSSWEEIDDLDLPKDISEFDAVITQKLDIETPRLVIKDKSGSVYTRCIGSNATGWEDEDFQELSPIDKKRKTTKHGELEGDEVKSTPMSSVQIPKTISAKKIYAVHQVKPNKIIVISSDFDGQIFAESFQKSRQSDSKSGNINNVWEYIQDTLIQIGMGQKVQNWVGSFQDKITKHIYILWWQKQSGMYSYKSNYYAVLDANNMPKVLRKKESFWFGLTRIACNSGASLTSNISSSRAQLLAYQTETKSVYRSLFRANEKNYLSIQNNTAKIAPEVVAPYDIIERLSQDDLQKRCQLISSVFKTNDGEPKSTLTYLEEAYYFLPVQLALYLQKRGYYISALDWLRNVYDYTVPDRQGTKIRKIYYPLKEEEIFTTDYKRFQNWLLDPLNPHFIAENRAHTYTRFTLISIIRCLLAYANAEFTLDTAESIARARSLYITAVELLETEELKQQVPCQELTIGLMQSVRNNVPPGTDALFNFESKIKGITNFESIHKLSKRIPELMKKQNPWKEKLLQAEKFVDDALLQEQLPTTLAKILEDSDHLVANSYRNLLRNEDILTSSRNIVNSTAITSANNLSSYFSNYLSVAEVKFCISPNPVIKSFKLQAELNLHKMRTCRNIAGMKRQLAPYASPTDQVSGLPQIGVSGQLLLPRTVTFRPTPYRYTFLIERAKQLVNIAQQMEASMLAALEKRDSEAYNQLQARQDIEVARAHVQLQTLRVKESKDKVKLAELQKERAQLQLDEYVRLLSEGLIREEAAALGLQITLTGAYSLAAAGAWALAAKAAIFSPGAAKQIAVEAAKLTVEATERWIQSLQLLASYERRREEWEFQKVLADQDVSIGKQEIKIAKDQVRVVGQELIISRLNSDHAKDTLNFLTNKFTNNELYDWMSDVLETVYSYFLQEATAVAKLAENQLAFERQTTPPRYIQGDYWKPPSNNMLSIFSSNANDRRGLTGSARLLQDIYQLDQYAFDTDKRKLQLSKTISLAALSPVEFQQFRQTGVMTFRTPLELFDRDFPGHYLRLIKQVRTSVLALVPPTQGIHATLTTLAASRVVIGGDIFQTAIVRRDPEYVALTSPRDATGLFELQQQSEMLLPFEGLGVDTTWEFRLPKAANQFDYSTIADVLITIDYTALNSFDYRQQVIQTLNPRISADRPFSFRNEFADAWYDLHNPEQTTTPMVVRFETRREDFPQNLDRLKIQQVVLYFVRKTGETFEVPVTHLHFTEQGNTAAVDGSATSIDDGATSIDGVISTRRGNASSWGSMLGKKLNGQWELSLQSNDPLKDRKIRSWFKDEKIEDILFVITYAGQTPDWPS